MSKCHTIYKSGLHLMIIARGYSPIYNQSCINWLQLLIKQAAKEYAAMENKTYEYGTLDWEKLITVLTWLDVEGPIYSAINTLQNLRKEWNVS